MYIIPYGIARFFNDAAAVVGAPFDFCAFVIGRGGVATIKGLRIWRSSHFTMRHEVVFEAALRAAEFVEAVYRRYHQLDDGTYRSHEVRVRL